jgi:hypothetical protein
MKKIIVFIFAIAIICSFAFGKIYSTKSVVDKTDEYRFSDLQTLAKSKDGKQLYVRNKIPGYYNNFAINEILKGSEIGIIEGYSDGTFRPNDSIAKGDFIKLAISLALGINNKEGFNRIDSYNIPTPFNHYTAKYIAIAEMQGVLNHGEINVDNVEDPITRIEVITILSKIHINMKGKEKFTDGKMPNYSDISTLTEEQKEYVLHAAKYRLLENMDNTTDKIDLKPYSNMTRAEVARALMRVY